VTVAIATSPPACFQPEARAILRRIGWFAAAFVLYFHASWCSAQSLGLAVDDIEGPGFSLKSLKGALTGPKLDRLTLDIARLTIRDRTWRDVRVSCAGIRIERQRIDCPNGLLHVGEAIPFSFSYSGKERLLHAVLRPSDAELWRVDGRFSARDGEWQINIASGRLSRLAGWLPAGAPDLKSGTIAGRVLMTQQRILAELQIDAAAFSDTKGLHAAENMRASIRAEATRQGAQWTGRASIDWQGGEVFWEPFYLKAAGQRADIELASDGKTTRVIGGRLQLPAIGDIDVSASWNHASAQLEYVDVRSSRLTANALYEQFLRPMLQGTAFSEIKAEGVVSVAARVQQHALQSLELTLSDVSVEDQAQRFALRGIDGSIPWQRDAATTAEISIQAGRMLQLPFDAVRIPMRLRGTGVSVDEVRVPILDGALIIRDFGTVERSEGRSWRFSGELTPLSMERLSATLGVPVMHGTVSGSIPDVRFYRSTLDMRGDLLLHVFDGTVVARNIQLIEPFGKAPRLHADLLMRNVDLELLTRTYSFGSITGRADATIAQLELVNWQPVRFDARIASSPGDYPRRISQAAVENISALGGAGAAAAIQRSFLSFFEQFGYEKLGLTCRLENGVCEMGGIEDTREGFVIVKGGGIPAISVIGYNRQVSWQQLLDRLRRITQENVRPIIK